MADPFEQFRTELQTALDDIEILKRGGSPPGTDLDALPMLEGWGYSDDTGCLRGMMWGHPEVPDGQVVTISPLLWLDGRRGLARSQDWLFRLGRSLSEILRAMERRDTRCESTPSSEVRLDQTQQRTALRKS